MIAQISKCLAASCIEHTVVTSRLDREHDAIVESWSDAVLTKLREAFRAGTVFESGKFIPMRYFELTPAQNQMFGELCLVLSTADGVTENGLPFGVSKGKSFLGMYRNTNPPCIQLPILEYTGKLGAAVKTLTTRHTLVHEAEHYLDASGKSLYPIPEDIRDSDHGLEWFDRTTELNAMWREVKTSIHRLLDQIRADLDKPTHKFTPAKVVTLFEALMPYPRFETSVRNSMLGIASGNAIFEFGKGFHFQHLAARVFSDTTVYRHKREFEYRLREIHREVKAWFEDYKKAVQ